MCRSDFAIACFAAISLQAAARSAAGEWPQFGGSTRDFRVATNESPKPWSNDGPKILWQRPLGVGYSGIVCDGDRLYTMYRDSEDEVVVCLVANDGATQWSHRYDAPIDKQQYAARYGYGPRSTPLVHCGRLFTVGFNGKMHCLDARNGRVIWSRNLLTDFNGNMTRWGYACSPLVWKDDVIVFTGGKGASIVALRQTDGRVRWRRHNYKNSYASPVLIDLDGQTQLVCFMMKQIVGLNPDDGRLYWEHPHENQWDNNIVTPAFGDDGLLFVTSEGTGGSRVLKLTRRGDRTAATELWHSRKIKISHRNVMRIGDVVYASTGDFGPKSFDAIDIGSGEFKWRRRDFAKCGLVLIGNHLLMLAEDGRLILARVDENGITVQSESSLLNHPAWTMPTVVGKRIFLRDDEKIIAVTWESEEKSGPGTDSRISFVNRIRKTSSGGCERVLSFAEFLLDRCIRRIRHGVVSHDRRFIPVFIPSLDVVMVRDHFSDRHGMDGLANRRHGAVSLVVRFAQATEDGVVWTERQTHESHSGEQQDEPIHEHRHGAIVFPVIRIFGIVKNRRGSRFVIAFVGKNRRIDADPRLPDDFLSVLRVIHDGLVR